MPLGQHSWAAAARQLLIIWLGFGYLLVHLASYIALFRHRPAFQMERGIFLFHFVSACVLPAAAFALSFDSGFSVAFLRAVALAAAHGIYSISFLELWSLASGSYSFIILRGIGASDAADAEKIVFDLGAVGDRKKDQRIKSLERLGLISQERGNVSLTRRGRMAAVFLRALQSNANLSETG